MTINDKSGTRKYLTMIYRSNKRLQIGEHRNTTVKVFINYTGKLQIIILCIITSKVILPYYSFHDICISD